MLASQGRSILGRVAIGSLVNKTFKLINESPMKIREKGVESGAGDG